MHREVGFFNFRGGDFSILPCSNFLFVACPCPFRRTILTLGRIALFSETAIFGRRELSSRLRQLVKDINVAVDTFCDARCLPRAGWPSYICEKDLRDRHFIEARARLHTVSLGLYHYMYPLLFYMYFNGTKKKRLVRRARSSSIHHIFHIHPCPNTSCCDGRWAQFI